MKKTLLVLMAIVMIGATQNLSLAQQKKIPGLDILGYGYNVFGKYADQASVKDYCLFTYSNFKEGNYSYTEPDGVLFKNMSKHIKKEISGKSTRDYAKSLSVAAGMEAETMFFSGSVNASYAKSSSGTTKRFYYTLMDANTKWRISLETKNDLAKLKTMLNPEFKADLNNSKISAADLFKTYGTHYVAYAYLGGRADYSSVTNITSKSNTSEIGLAVKAKYGAVSGSAEMTAKQSETLSNSKTETNLTVTGGNSEYVSNISDPVSYEKWASGIADMPVLCDFASAEDGAKSLRPIWEFCTNDARKNELKAEFDKMCKANPLPKEMADLTDLSTSTFMIKNKANNLYWDFEGYSSAAKTSGAKLLLAAKDKSGQGFDRVFRVSALNENDFESVYFQPQHCDKVLAISGGSKEANSDFMLSGYNAGFKSQKYILEPVEGAKNNFFIKVKYTGMYLTAKDGKVIQTESAKSSAQTWIFEKFDPKDIALPKTAFYAVKSVATNKYWDFAGTYPNVSGSKLESAKMGKQEGDRVYKFVLLAGTNDYLIRPGHQKAKVLTAIKAGQQLYVFDQTRSDNQLFNFEYGGSPNSYVIVHKGTKNVIHLRSDRLQMDGVEIKVYKRIKGAKYQQWKLIFHK